MGFTTQQQQNELQQAANAKLVNTAINSPSRCILGGVELSRDILITVDGDKVIAESKILDGVEVTERIGRNAYEINFEFTARQLLLQDMTGFADVPDATVGGSKDKHYIFPVDILKQIVNKIWSVDAVIDVTNTMLNDIFKINQVIIKKHSYTPIRGNTDVMVRIEAKENVMDGDTTTLIVDDNYMA